MVRTFLLAGWLVWLFSIGQTESFSMTAAQPEPTPRARYLNPNTGRFWSMDSFEGDSNDPRSLHKYLYCSANPGNLIDLSGHDGDLISLGIAGAIGAGIDAAYNGAVMAAGNSMQATLFGVQAGQGANEILKGFIFDETGIGMAIGAYQAVRDLFQDEESKAMAAYMLWQEQLVATILTGMDDNEYGQIAVEFVPQCFVAGTPVATEDDLKSIEEIKPGDKVWAYDESTHAVTLRPVLKTFIHRRSEVMEIKVGCDKFDVTGEHPFYVSGKGWTSARDIIVGDQLVTVDDSTIPVDSIENQTGDFLVYNFEVSTDHDYYVGEEGVLTHNLNALRAAMQLKNPLLAAHHIVAIKAMGAAGARRLLLAPGTGIINLNDIRNGVPLPKNLEVKIPGYANSAVHSVIHTTKYYRELENRLAAVAPGQRIKVLSQTARELLIGKFPYQ